MFRFKILQEETWILVSRTYAYRRTLSYQYDVTDSTFNHTYLLAAPPSLAAQ